MFLPGWVKEGNIEYYLRIEWHYPLMLWVLEFKKKIEDIIDVDGVKALRTRFMPTRSRLFESIKKIKQYIQKKFHRNAIFPKRLDQN